MRIRVYDCKLNKTIQEPQGGGTDGSIRAPVWIVKKTKFKEKSIGGWLYAQGRPKERKTDVPDAPRYSISI